MLVGCVLNIILDALFIFVLNIGIKGAALETIISQFFCYLGISLLYKRKIKLKTS